MRRRRDRVRARGSLLWWPPLVLAGLVVVAGGANRFYDLHRQGVTTYGVVVVGLALIGLYTYSRIRRWWR